MKKLISLLLVAMLVLTSMTVIAAPEDYVSGLLAELSIMNGDAYGNMRLDDYVTRAEFTKIAVASSAERNTVSKTLAVSPFKDVLSGCWEAPYVAAAVSSGLCTGYPDGSFRPGSLVTYEESVTVLLKLLGYTDSDFGLSWPYGQIGIAEKIGLCDNLNAAIGQPLTRREVMLLLYNLLNTKSKGASLDYITTFDYKIAEDVILIASSNEDSSVGSGKVFTSAGLYKVSSDFDYGNIGKKGDLVIKDGDEITTFIPAEQTIRKYSIYQVLGSDIIVYENGRMSALETDKTLGVYNKSARTTLNAMLPQLSAGDMLVTYSTADGTADYGVVKTDEMCGPYTYTSSAMLATAGLEKAFVTRDGSPSAASALQAGDIIYYSVPLNTVWGYSTKITGIYEKAIPNKDNPTSIQLSGATYAIESADAFNKLSSSGNLEYGDTITVMLGRNNRIADVMSKENNSEIYGYLLGTGTKEFVADDTGEYVNNFIRVALTDGRVCEYSAAKDYETLINSPVRITFSDGFAKPTATAVSSSGGSFSWSAKTLGDKKLSPSLKILDIYSVNRNDATAYAPVFPQRLDGAQLSSANILFEGKNSNDEIDELILKNVTGDFYTYGIVTKAESSSFHTSIFGSYSYVADGVEKNFVTTDRSFNVGRSQAVRILYKNGAVELMQPLTKLTGTLQSLTEQYALLSGARYPIGDKATVYVKDANNDYTVIPLKDAVAQADNWNITVFSDKNAAGTGRIRIIVLEKK